MFKLSRLASQFPHLEQLTHNCHFHRSGMAETTKSEGKSRNRVARRQDPVAADELKGKSQPQLSETISTSKRTNAFTELMSAKKPKPTPEPAETPAKRVNRGFRNGLGLYIEQPERNPEGLVVEYDEHFVVINDKFPKASVHLLLIPRAPEYYNAHPLHLLSTNPAFLAEVQQRVIRLKHLAASELRRKYGRYSVSDAPYQTALEGLMESPGPPPPDERDAILPPGRDWLSEIKAGVHTHPSMNHMHIHIVSREMQSPCLMHKKHYLSFNSSFFVGVDEFPLQEGSGRYKPGDWPKWDMDCWRCGENYQNKFAKLKAHLGEEFEAWKRE